MSNGKRLGVLLFSLILTVLTGCEEKAHLNITSPQSGKQIYVGEDVQLAGTATLKSNPIPDGVLSWWLADRQVGSGRSAVLSGLAVGTYRVVFKAQMQDHKGKSHERHVERDFQVVDKAPEVRILRPTNGAQVGVDQPVHLEASAQDREDGVLDAGRIVWRSSLNGDLGTGAIVTRNDLKPGKHSITASIQDSASNTGTGKIEIHIVNEAPRAQIVAPADQTFSYAAQAVTLEGDATDKEDGVLPESAFQWWSSLRRTALGTGRRLVVIGLEAGDHLLTLKVLDRHGSIGTATVVHKVLDPYATAPVGPPPLPVSTPGRFTTIPLGGDTATALFPAVLADEVFVGTDASGLLVLDADRSGGWQVDRSLAFHIPFLAAPRVSGLVVSQNYVWAARRQGGVRRYHRATGITDAIFDVGSGLPSDDVLDIFKDSVGRIWATTALGLARFQAGVWVEPTGQPRALTFYPGAARMAEGDGHLWIATASGLVRYTPDTKQWKTYDRYSHVTMTSDELTTIAYRNSDATVWLGTRRDGLLQYRPGVGFRSFSQRDGLVADEITTLAVDRRDRVWVGTTSGLSRFDGLWTNYVRGSGLADHRVESLAVDELDRLWIGLRDAVQLLD